LLRLPFVDGGWVKYYYGAMLEFIPTGGENGSKKKTKSVPLQAQGSQRVPGC